MIAPATKSHSMKWSGSRFEAQPFLFSFAGSLVPPASSTGSAHLLHRRRRPGTVNDRSLRPVGSHEQREISIFRRKQPICLFIRARGLGLYVDRQRSILIVLQRLVL